MNVLQAITPGTIYFGDCLDIMQGWQPEQADLVYLDPPFNSKKNYNILFGTQADGKSSQFLAFEDTWQWDASAQERVQLIRDAVAHPAHDVIDGLYKILGPSGMLSYISYMAERLHHAGQILKPTGSIYLHCDPTASHYLKIVMDALFGPACFMNELVWYYKNASRGKRQWAKAHDVLLWYSRSASGARFNRDDVLADFESGMTKWRYEKGGQAGKPVPEGKTPDDVIVMPSLNAMSKERLGYPTQKPRELLELIVSASSNEGDLVLDPFCGCGTTLVAAQGLKRRWAGIDTSAFAVENVMKWRLNKVGVKARTEGIPTDLAGARVLAASDAFKFEAWAVNQVSGLAPNEKKTGDRGIDGRGTLLDQVEGFAGRLVLAQVKAGKPTMDSVRAFCSVVESNNAVAGVFITLKSNWTRGMTAEFAKLGNFRREGSSEDFPRIQFWSLEDHFLHGTRPKLPSLADPVTGKAMMATLWEQKKDKKDK